MSDDTMWIVANGGVELLARDAENGDFVISAATGRLPGVLVLGPQARLTLAGALGHKGRPTDA